MTTEITPARIRALVIVGVALLAAGVSSVWTLWASAFARYMYIEDLGLAEATEFAIARDPTPVDHGLAIFGGILVLLGAATLVAAAVLVARHRRRAGR